MENKLERNWKRFLNQLLLLKPNNTKNNILRKKLNYDQGDIEKELFSLIYEVSNSEKIEKSFLNRSMTLFKKKKGVEFLKGYKFLKVMKSLSEENRNKLWEYFFVFYTLIKGKHDRISEKIIKRKLYNYRKKKKEERSQKEYNSIENKKEFLSEIIEVFNKQLKNKKDIIDNVMDVVDYVKKMYSNKTIEIDNVKENFVEIIRRNKDKILEEIANKSSGVDNNMMNKKIKEFFGVIQVRKAGDIPYNKIMAKLSSHPRLKEYINNGDTEILKTMTNMMTGGKQKDTTFSDSDIINFKDNPLSKKEKEYMENYFSNITDKDLEKMLE